MVAGPKRSAFLPYTPASSLSAGLHLHAAIGGGPAHLFEIDTGSVGILVPRSTLGPAFQNYDPSLDTKVSFVSSKNSYWGQWVKAPVVLGVPQGWDGTGDYPSAEIDVFAVDRPADFNGGILGVGFAIGDEADGGPARNPFLHVHFHGEKLHGGYMLTADGLELGLNAANTAGFGFLELQRNDDDSDWAQPPATLAFGDDFRIDLPLLLDTGVANMLLWLDPARRPPALANASPLPAGVSVSISAPPASGSPALAYAFTTGDPADPAAPPQVIWRNGRGGINTGRHILASADYLYDGQSGRLGFRRSAKAL